MRSLPTDLSKGGGGGFLVFFVWNGNRSLARGEVLEERLGVLEGEENQWGGVTKVGAGRQEARCGGDFD